MLSAAVTTGLATVFEAWPEFFGLEAPGRPDPEQPGFVLEKATPESYASDIAAMVAASRRVTLREPAPQRPAPPPPEPEHTYIPDTEWT